MFDMYHSLLMVQAQGRLVVVTLIQAPVVWGILFQFCIFEKSWYTGIFRYKPYIFIQISLQSWLKTDKGLWKYCLVCYTKVPKNTGILFSEIPVSVFESNPGIPVFSGIPQGPAPRSTPIIWFMGKALLNSHVKIYSQVWGWIGLEGWLASDPVG